MANIKGKKNCSSIKYSLPEIYNKGSRARAFYRFWLINSFDWLLGNLSIRSEYIAYPIFEGLCDDLTLCALVNSKPSWNCKPLLLILQYIYVLAWELVSNTPFWTNFYNAMSYTNVRPRFLCLKKAWTATNSIVLLLFSFLIPTAFTLQLCECVDLLLLFFLKKVYYYH